MSVDFGLQQPYIPVCLMTSITAGTVYHNELDMFRRFRDEYLLEKGFVGESLVKSYYWFSGLVCGFVEKHPLAGNLLLRIWFKPLTGLFKFFGWRK
mgnify:CR=1 FL=1